MRRIALPGLLAAGLFCAASASAAALSDKTLLRMAPMAFEPTVDGRISTDEARACSVSYGAVSPANGLMTLRHAVFHFGYTAKGVYFAARTSVPPLPQTLTDDDRVTLQLLPPGAAKPAEIVLKVLDGTRLKGVVDYGVECAETEAFVTYEQLGVPHPADGAAWGLQMRVDFSSVAETGWWHLPAAAGEFGTFIPDAACPIVSVMHFAPLDSWRSGGSYDFEFRAANPTRRAMKVVSATRLLLGVGVSKLDNEAEEETARQTVNVRYASPVEPGVSRANYHRATSIWPGTVNTMAVDIRAGDGKTAVYRRSVSWDLAKGVKWKDAVGLPTLLSAFYPSKGNRFRTGYRANGVKNLVRGGIIVTGPEGKRYFERAFKGTPYLAHEVFDTTLGELPLGDYVVRFAAVDEKGKKYTDEKTFSVAKFPWQGLGIGTERIILPPFKPIKMEMWNGGKVEGEGEQRNDKISFLQTGYRCEGILWDEVYAKGENILAAPVDFKLNGKRFVVTDVKFVERSPDRVVREVTAHQGDLRLVVTQEYDYDGYCDVRFAFTPEKPVKVDSLVMEMPLKDSVVSLFNETVRGGNVRGLAAPEFSIPSGEGVLWSSDRKAPRYQLDLFGAYVSPYVWLGGPEKGFCWLISTIRDMSLKHASAAQRIVRRNGAVALESDYVSEPVVWDSPKSFRMGFQPTPVKPQEQRFYGLASHMHAYLCPSNAVGLTLSGVGVPKMWPLIYPNNLYPGNDTSLLEFMINCRKVDKPLYQRKVNEYTERYRKWFDEHTHMTADSFRESMDIHWRMTGCEFMVDYMNPWIHSCHWPEWEMYKGEWTRWEWPVENDMTEYGSKDCASRIDKLLYDAKFSLDHGMKGIYFDCFEQARDYNWVMGGDRGAYRKADGSIQISCNEMFAWREFVKRTATLCYKNGGMAYGRPWVEIHATSFQLIPVLSFATTALMWERGGDGGEYQDRFGEGYLLTDVLCRQSGAVPRLIVSTRAGDEARKQRELKSLFSLMCAMGVFSLCDQGIVYADWFRDAWNVVFDAGWGDADAEMHWYYDGKPQPVKHDGKDVRVNSVKRGGKALVVFGNLGEATDVAFDVSGLGLGDHPILTDAETGKPLADGRIHLDRRGYALVRVQGK